MVQQISGLNFDRDQFIQKLQAAGITQEEMQTARSAGPDAFQQLLQSHGIQAPATPPPADNDAFMQKLQAAGITKEEFHTAFSQGPDAVRKLLEAHGIQAPDNDGKIPGKHGGHGEFMKKLEAAGISKAEFEAAKAQGPDAVAKLLEAHGIQPQSKSQSQMQIQTQTQTKV